MRVSIIGAGNAGLTLSGHLALLGHDVYLYENSLLKDNILELKKDLTINLTGLINGTGKIKKASTNIKEIIDEGEIIVITVPAQYRNKLINEMINYLKEGQFVILMPDYYSSFDLSKKLKSINMLDKVKIVGLNTCMYACRKINFNTVIIKGMKNEVLLNSINGFTEDAYNELNEIYPLFKKRDNIYEICLTNLNCVVHTASTIMNCGWIETTNGNFDFYGDGISPSVAKVIEQVDKERIEVANKVGVKVDSLLDSMKKIYDIDQPNIYKALSQSIVHANAFAPKSLKCRYIAEDIPYGLVPISNLGKRYGVETKVIDSIITLANVL